MSLYNFLFKSYRFINTQYGHFQQRFLKSYALPPLRIFVFLTFRCNCICEFCDTHLPHSDDLSLEQIKLITKQLPQGSIITFTGGEPSIVKDFLKIIEHTAKRFNVQICTNGATLNEDVITKLIDYGVSKINFSVDTAKDNIHDKIRGPKGLLEKIIRSIKQINKIKHERKLSKPFIHVNTVILKETIPHLKDMVTFCTELAVDSLSFGGLKAESYDENDLMALKRAFKEIGELTNNKHLFFDMNRSASIEIALSGGQLDISDFTCHAPWTTLQIDPDGSIRACTAKELSINNKISSSVLGNIKNTPFKELWNNKIAQNFRNDLLEGKKLSPQCLTCCLISRK